MVFDLIENFYTSFRGFALTSSFLFLVIAVHVIANKISVSFRRHNIKRTFLTDYVISILIYMSVCFGLLAISLFHVVLGVIGGTVIVAMMFLILYFL